MRVAVVDHGMGNLRSVAKALEAAGATPHVISSPDDASSADALCVPGQGIFGRCMTNLAGLGLDDLVRTWIRDARPYLGICLGLQILFDASEEGGVQGLGVLGGRVVRLSGRVKVPHIGWNEVETGDGVASREHYYFDHSFAAHPADDAIVTGWSEHGERFAATVETGSVLGVQFHPEKSGRAGIALLRRWVEAA